MKLYLRMLWRELRGAPVRALFFVSCLSIAVAALVTVATVASAVEQGLRAHARELLGGDLSAESRSRPLPALPAELKDRPRVGFAMLSTMVRSAGRSRLSELKAIDSLAYPLAGALELSPAQPLRSLLNDDTVLVARELLAELSVEVGDTVEIGSRGFRIAGIVVREPDPRGFTFTLGPRVLMTRNALAQTGLLTFGSRVLYKVVIAAPELAESRLSALAKQLGESLGPHVSVESRYEAQPALRASFQRVQPYLGLVALLSLLVASVGVAQIVSAWLAQTVKDTAILRCLGMSPRELLALYLGHVLVLGLIGSSIGALLGALAPWAIARTQPAMLPAELLGSGFALLPVLRAFALGVLVPVLFSLPALLSIHTVPPGRVLRTDAEPLPMPRRLQGAALAACALALLGAAYLQTERWDVAAIFSAGFAALAAVLALSARALVRALAGLRSARLPAWLWHGAAALQRPGSAAIGSMVALGLGTTVVLSMQLLQDTLDRDLAAALPRDAPSLFLLDVQPDQWRAVEQLARELGATSADSVPVAMVRLTAIDGATVDKLVKARPGNPNTRAHWVLTREQRVTWGATLPHDNRLLEGALWSRPGVDEVSVEANFARDLGVKLGSVLDFDLQGVPLSFTVTSLRSVEWRSFSANFFLVVEPGVLERAPHVRLGTLRIAQRDERMLQDRIAGTFPNITVLRVRDLVERALEVLQQAALAVRVLGGFALVTGIAILVGAVAASGTRRVREAAVLRALGVRRGQIARLLAVELALRGGVAGLLGAAGAYGLTYACSRFVLELETRPDWLACAIALAVVMALAVVGGLLASVRALVVSPISVLRRPL
ncbi:MAG: FtsX-like permease family protein [Polyangiales bacterium]